MLGPVTATGDLARRFGALYTGALTDVLDRHGYLLQTLPSELTPLEPGTRLAGPAYPVLGRPHPGHDYDTSIRRILEMLGSVPAGHVAPGDWIVGDRDGVVVVPGEGVDELLAEAEAKVATENEIRDSVRQGLLPLDAYERYGTF